MNTKNKIWTYIIALLIQIYLLQNQVTAVDTIISVNTTINTNTTYDSLVIKNGATLTLDAALTVTGDATIENGGILTHSTVASTDFNLIVGGTLDLQAGSKIDVSIRGYSTLGVGSTNVGASYGGYGGSGASLVPYGDIYNPIHVGSYGRSGSYPGGGLVRLTAGNLINNGSILANGESNLNYYGQGSGGGINITVTNLLSGAGIYSANGGNAISTGTGVYSFGGGGRIAIKYGSSSNSIDTLKAKTSAFGDGSASAGTVYLKNTTSGEDYLIIRNINKSKASQLLGNVSISNLIVDNAVFNSNYNFTLDKNINVLNGTLNNYGVIIADGNLNISSSTLYTGNSSASITSNGSGTLAASTLNLNSPLNISGDFIVSGNSTITHNTVSTTDFNLIVGGTLDLQAGSKIDVSNRGYSTLGVGSTNVGASYGGYGGSGASLVPYGDIYNPIHVGSYGRSGSYPGGGLVRLTAGNLINNGSILANGESNLNYYGQGSGGGINITVTNLLSGAGTYSANGGNAISTGTGIYSFGGGGRIALKYGSSSNSIDTLKAKTSAFGNGVAGQGTIYLKNLTTGLDYLIVKGNGLTSSSKYTGVGLGYSQYYFDTIESISGGKLYEIGAQNVLAKTCLKTGSPLGIIDTNITCNAERNFYYYDLSVDIKNYGLNSRKYEFLIDGPLGGANFAEAFTGVISGNGVIPTRIKITKLGNYDFTFNIYDSDLDGSEIDKSATKSVQVNAE